MVPGLSGEILGVLLLVYEVELEYQRQCRAALLFLRTRRRVACFFLRRLGVYA